MGSTAGFVDGGTIIRAAWRQPGAGPPKAWRRGVGQLSESVSNTPFLFLGRLRHT